MSTASNCYLRILHGVPGGPPVDIYINEELVVKGFSYRDFTQYAHAAAGIYHISVHTAGQKQPLMERRFALMDQTISTLALIGTAHEIDGELICDALRTPDSNQAFIRFINISPPESAFDLSVNDANILSDLIYREVSEYLPFTPGTYGLVATDSATHTVVLENPRMRLDAGKYYAGYLIGYPAKEPQMQILLPLEGCTYLK